MTIDFKALKITHKDALAKPELRQQYLDGLVALCERKFPNVSKFEYLSNEGLKNVGSIVFENPEYNIPGANMFSICLRELDRKNSIIYMLEKNFNNNFKIAYNNCSLATSDVAMVNYARMIVNLTTNAEYYAGGAIKGLNITDIKLEEMAWELEGMKKELEFLGEQEAETSYVWLQQQSTIDKYKKILNLVAQNKGENSNNQEAESIVKMYSQKFRPCRFQYYSLYST